MTSFHGKDIFSTDLSAGDPYRRDYRDDLTAYVNGLYERSAQTRRDFFTDAVVRDREACRRQYLDMLGQPPGPYPDSPPAALCRHAGRDGLCDVSYVQLEVLPGLRFFGLLLVPFGAVHAPIVIAQHGGGSMPEICSDFLGESAYGFFTRRALERGMVVFAPQLLLWKFDHDLRVQKHRTDLPYERGALDAKLRHLGMSITGLEVFCLRRCLDYLQALGFTDPDRVGMMGVSYGGYYSLHTAAADTRIRSVYAAAFFNDRTKICFGDWRYRNAANTFCDAEVAGLIAPRRLLLDVGKADQVFDYAPSVAEAERAAAYFALQGVPEQFRFNLWEGAHSFDRSGLGFDFFFDAI